jgi:hypothetical protein
VTFDEAIEFLKGLVDEWVEVDVPMPGTRPT